MNEHDVKSLVSDLSSIDGIFVSKTFPIRTRKYAQGYRVYAKYIFDDQQYAQNLETLVKNGCDKNTVLDDRGECVKKFMDSAIRSIIDKYSNLNIAVYHKLWGIAGHDVWDEVTLTVNPASGIAEDLETELEIPAPYNQYYEFSPNEVNFDELPDAFDHYKELKVVAELYAKEQYEDALADNCLDFCWLVEDEVGKLLLVTTAGLRVYPITLEEIQDCVGEPSYDDDYDDYDEDLDEDVELTDAQRLALNELDAALACGEVNSDAFEAAQNVQWDINFEDVVLFINGIDVALSDVKHVEYGDCAEYDGCYSVTMRDGTIKKFGWYDGDMSGTLYHVEDCDEGILSSITGMAPIGLSEGTGSDTAHVIRDVLTTASKEDKDGWTKTIADIIDVVPDQYIDDLYDIASEKLKDVKVTDSERKKILDASGSDIDLNNDIDTVGKILALFDVQSWDAATLKKFVLVVLGIVAVIEPTPVLEIVTALVSLLPADIVKTILSITNMIGNPVGAIGTIANRAYQNSKNEDYARVDAKDFIKHPMNYDVTSMLEFEVQDDVKVYIHRGPGRQREFYIIIGDTYVQHAFNKLETVEKYLRRNNLVKEVISESFKPGDVVYVTVCNRQGRVRKMISPDVVEVELHDNGIYPERIDRYYVDEVELQYSDDLDDEF